MSRKLNSSQAPPPPQLLIQISCLPHIPSAFHPKYQATPALGRWEATLPHWYSHNSYSQASHLARPETGPPHQYICNSCDHSLHTAMLRANPIRQHSCSGCSMASQPATQEISPVHKSVSSSCGSHIRGRHNKNPAHSGDMSRVLGSSDQGRFHYRHHRVPSTQGYHFQDPEMQMT